MSGKLIKKIRVRLFAKEQLLLYRFARDTHQLSEAVMHPASSVNISDVLHFDTPDNLSTFITFLQRGDRGYLMYLGKICVHRSWVICTPRKVFLHWSLPMHLMENEAYIHFCETATEARGKNIFPHALSSIARDLHDYKNVYICVNARNMASIRSIEKAGFVCLKSVRIVALLGVRIHTKET